MYNADRRQSWDTERTNRDVIQMLQYGDIIRFTGPYVTHWAVYVGNSVVVHVGRFDEKSELGEIMKETITNVVGDYQMEICNDWDGIHRASPKEDIVKRALENLGPTMDDAQQFVMFCRYGIQSTHQRPLTHSEMWYIKALGDKNKQVFFQLKPGDLIKIKRSMFYHWAVYIGGGDVIHVDGEDATGRSGGSGTISGLWSGYKNSRVKKEKIWDVVRKDTMELDNGMDKDSSKPLDGAEVVRRAVRKLGPIQYHPALKNCEHFAKWCRYDAENCSQSKPYMVVGAALGGMLLGGPMFGLLSGLSVAAKMAYNNNQEKKRSFDN
ncbi:uncharacterized protein LOC131957209 [Physella acuta]|uniref:uncharacterized protein LOC131957209 n=1 Tax=Physella acuta TaxID=109671 RepID=UPI0027DD4454|nr:uncharacterized protein LOC131957209 [Physella acuta]